MGMGGGCTPSGLGWLGVRSEEAGESSWKIEQSVVTCKEREELKRFIRRNCKRLMEQFE